MKSLIDKKFWILAVVGLVFLLFILFIVAVFFDFYNKPRVDKGEGELPNIKGDVGVLGTPVQKSFNSFNAPWEYAGLYCALNPVLVASGLKPGDILKVNGITGNICVNMYLRPFTCVSDIGWGCVIKACNSPFEDSNGNIKRIAIGFYNDQGSSHSFISESALIDFQNGNIVIPSGANAAYAYFREYSIPFDYSDNNGAYNCTFSAEIVCTDTCNSLGYQCGTQTICRVGTDCGGCTGGCSQCNNGQCVAKTAGILCRASTGVCDITEYCDGSSVWCPPDSFNPPTTKCRDATGLCDLAAYCSGSSAPCPANPFKPPTTVCRTSSGVCDKIEYCSGTSSACPVDLFNSSTTICRASTNDCDLAENCIGSSANCPVDNKKSDGTTCNIGLPTLSPFLSFLKLFGINLFAQGQGICSNGNCVESCVANCTGKECGSDGCGGICGSNGGNCSSGLICNSIGKCVTPPDTNPPTILSISVSAISNDSTTIIWNTNENSNSSVNYGINISNLNNSNSNSDMMLSHALSLLGLTSSTLYYYSVASCDNAGNCATSGINNFTTSAETIPSIDNPPGNGDVGVTTPNTCTENWNCGSWGNCIKEVVKRICIDANGCGTDLHKPITIINCMGLNNSLNATGPLENPAENDFNVEIVYALEVLTVGFIVIIITLLILKYFNDKIYNIKKIDHKIKKKESKENIKSIKVKDEKDSFNKKVVNKKEAPKVKLIFSEKKHNIQKSAKLF